MYASLLFDLSDHLETIEYHHHIYWDAIIEVQLKGFNCSKMKTPILLVALSILIIILACYPQESNAVVFILSRGRIRGTSAVKRGSAVKRKKRLMKRLRRMKKHQKRSQMYRDIRRWLKRYKQKVGTDYRRAFHTFLLALHIFMYLTNEGDKFH